MDIPPVGVGFNTANSYNSRPGFQVPDPFGPRRGPYATAFNALLATAFFRCWHLLVFFGAWSTLITALNEKGHKLFIQATLLTVVGTVLGFVISYRTTSSFERYNEGRRYWSQVVLANRTFARTAWFHVTDPAATAHVTAQEQAARSMIEKKSVINLLEAFAVSLKHYLRGEDGIFYHDLYCLVKHLPGYSMPAGRPSMGETRASMSPSVSSRWNKDPLSISTSPPRASGLYQRACVSAPDLPTGDPLLPTPFMMVPPAPAIPLSQLKKPTSTTFLEPPPRRTAGSQPIAYPWDTIDERLAQQSEKTRAASKNSRLNPSEVEQVLLPAYMPPKYHLFDLFPFSILMKLLAAHGKDVKGKKAARLRARMLKDGKRGQGAGGGNLPLEITLYLSSYIAALQGRKQVDVPTLNTLLAALNQLVDALTGLERILTTPIPFSYSFHLWAVTMIYCLALPFQIYVTLKWMTVPGTVIVSFFFFGFIVAGEEIENPFGYDKNDLNLDYFTHNIIRNELKSLTSIPPPDPAVWAFSMDNDMLFAARDECGNQDFATPDEWVKRGHGQILNALRVG